MATIATVSPTELIRSTWGNSVAVELNTRCVKVDGSTPMSGPLITTTGGGAGIKLRNTSNNPTLQFESTTGTYYGSIAGGATSMGYDVGSPSGFHLFYVNSTQQMYIAGGSVGVGGQFQVGGSSEFAAPVKIGGNGNQVALVDTATSGSNFHNTNVAFYGAGVSMVSPGSRTGYVGYPGTSELRLSNEVSGGGIALYTAGGGALMLNGGPITFAPGSGSVTFSLASAATVPFYFDGVYAADIRKTTGGVQFVNCVATAPSDHRLKNILGPVTNAVGRVLELQPYRLSWKATGEQFDGFIAHELDVVIPNSVYGVKDAVKPDGSIDPQQVTMEPVVPLLTAAIQELAQRVEALEAV